MTDVLPNPALDSVAALLTAWTRAERDGDTDRLDSLLTPDFHAVGPLGFLLPRGAWLARHLDGDLTYDTFALEDVHTREFDDAALITARNNTIGAYRGQPIPEAVRVTLLAVSTPAGWRLAHAHMSFLAGTRGAPPIPASKQ